MRCWEGKRWRMHIGSTPDTKLGSYPLCRSMSILRFYQSWSTTTGSREQAFLMRSRGRALGSCRTKLFLYHKSAHSSTSTAEHVLEEIPPATPTSLPKLTVHTVTSMLAGASREFATLTTNRSSVKVVLKEMRRACGRGGCEHEMGDVEKAALWILDPRSLSEGMRSE
jgi:hypothetical protein